MVFEQSSVKENGIKIRIISLVSATVLLLSSCGNTEQHVQTETATPNAVVETSIPAAEEQKTVITLCAETGYCYDYYWDDASERIAASVKYPYMHLSETDRQSYPKLEQAVTSLMQERKDNAQKLYKEAMQSAKETPVEDPEHPPFFDVTETVNVRRADSRVFSLMFEGSFYTGGPHGQPYTLGAVFDTETGERLKLTDVVTDIGLLPDLVKEQLEAFWDMDYLYDNLDLNKFFNENLESVAWVLDYQGLSIYFQPYDIAPYASGTQNVTISFPSHPEFVKEKYRDVPESYGIEFTAEKPFFYDVDGDGKSDSLTISAAKGEDDNYKAQSVTLNGETFEEDTGIYVIEPTLLHTADGKNYLYIGQQYPDDYWVFEVFDISKGIVKKVDTVYSERHNIIDYTNDYYARQVLTNPQNFILDTYTQMLGTAYGCDIYHIGTNGLPVQEHNWHIICSERELTLLKDLTVPVVGEDGKTIGTKELKPGDKALYYRTDGKTWADLKLPDGRIVRVNPRHEDGEWTVDGINVEEVFDGVIFGG